MPISSIANQPRRRGKTFITKDALTQSTATIRQSPNPFTDLTTLGMGTATGYTINRYRMGGTSTGVSEGMTKAFLATATGEANLQIGGNGGTATGLWVFSHKDDFMEFVFWGGDWRVRVNSGATLATDTA